ncbi:MAG TPA: prolyl oligopeptidase family serine peptidase [Actinomycetota bacterium]|nr:prolyl oligopeptidase family serine peptidase [Actinomycetota bacterium]
MRAASEYPSAYARTKRFTLGAPRTFTVSPDGRRVLFLRSRAGDDPVNALWSFEVDAAEEHLLFDPLAEGAADAEVSQAELDRRERMGERAAGITAYTTDAEVTKAVFALGARLVLVDVETGETFDLVSDNAVDDPRLDPTGRRVAYVLDGALHVLDLERADRVLADEDDPDVSWGLPEFVAAEEMDRYRGMWWSPDGEWLAAERSDVGPVLTWWIADLAEPGKPPRPIRYPQAGTDDAIVTLHVFDVRNGERVEVRWDRDAFPYLGRVDWTEGAPLTVLVVSRDQRRTRLLEVAPSGSTTVVREESDPEWIDLPFGAPTRMSDGSLVTISADREIDAHRLVVDGEAVTDPGWEVTGIVHAGDDVVFNAVDRHDYVNDEPDVWRWRRDGTILPAGGREPGAHSAVVEGGVTVLTSATLDRALPETNVYRDETHIGTIRSNADEPPIGASPRFMVLGGRRLRVALLLPDGREPASPVPVLLDPYGGPHFSRVVHAQMNHLTSQWFADELGVAVLVVDGRGTPWRSPSWERSVLHDFTVTLEDQVDALEAAASELGFLDRSRVAIRGWSFGGYLSAMAVLRRPDVFHAAVAGAAVTDPSLYDTYYMERYLGTPQDEPEVYARNSIVDDAPKLERPLLLIHGMADDNVVVANTLQLSAALFAAGRHHELVLLPTGTHRHSNEEAVLRLEADFLRRALRLGG